MKGFRKGISAFVAISLAIGSLAPALSLKAGAAIDGVDPSIDPTVNKSDKLPTDYDQAMAHDGMPNGMFVIGDIGSSSYGVATGADGRVYYADYSGTIRVKSPDKLGYVSLLSKEEQMNTGISNLYAIAINGEGNIVYGQDGENSGGCVGIYNVTTKTKATIITSLTRPRQITLDSDGNVYVACEDGAIKKWEKSTGTVSPVTSNLFGAQGIAVLPDGTIYVLCYSRHSDSPLIGVSYSGGKLYQINNGKANAVFGGDTQYVWRARGLTVDEHGYLYVSGESNAWDNGNSSLFARFNPGQRTLNSVFNGLDFSTFNAYGEDGRFYMPLARDQKLLAYSEKAEAEFEEQTWTDVRNARVSTYGGSYVAASDSNLTLNIDDLTLTGKVTVKSGSDKVCGWVKVPGASLQNVSKDMIPHPEESPMPGMYALPEVTATAKEGTVATSVIPLREHKRARWPLQDLYHAAADFSEGIDSYLVYFEWTPYDLDTYTPPADKVYDDFLQPDMTPADPPVIDAEEDENGFDFSNSDAEVTKAGDVHIINFNAANAYTMCTGTNVAFKFRFTDANYDWVGFAFDNTGVAGLGNGNGIRGILGKNSYSSTVRVVETAEGKGWDAVAGTQQLADGPIVPDDENANSGQGFADGNWHTFVLSGATGTWSLKVDGHEVFKSKYANCDADLTRMLPGEGKTFLTLYSSSNMGGVEIEEIVANELENKLDFSESEATITGADDITIIDFNGKNAFAQTAMNGLEFQFRWADASSFDWMGLALSNSGVHGLGDGEGVRAIIWKPVPNMTARVIDSNNGKGWDAVAATQTLIDGPVAGDSAPEGYSFNDGKWHTLKIEKTGKTWSIKVDGYEIIKNRYEGCDADLDSLMGANNATLTLYTASGLGKVEIRQSAGAGRQKLETKITSAETLWNSKTIGNRPGQVPKTEYDALKAAIDSAKAIVAKANATTEEINNEIEALQTAVYNFTVAIVPPTNFTELNAKIVEAKALKEKTGVGTDIGKAPQSAHDAFQTAISAAETVAGTTDALQAEVNDALAALEAAMKSFISKIVLATDTLVFDFVGDKGTGFDVPGTANKNGEETNINLPATGSVAYTQVTGTNLEFSFKIAPTETFEWLGINLSNSGMSMLGSGNGLSTLFWKAQGAVTSRVVEEQPGKGWDAAGANKQIHDGGLLAEGECFNDGEWHKVSLKKTADGWQFTIDDIDVIANRYEGFDDDMDRLLGGSNTVTMTLFTNGTAGSLVVLQEGVDAGLNVTALNKLIEDAEKALADAIDDRIPQSAKDALKKATDEAKAVIAAEGTVQADIEMQKKKMTTAMTAFNQVLSDVQKTRELSAGIDAINGEVTEDNLYDTILLQDTYDQMTKEQQTLLPEAEKARLDDIMKQAKAIMRTDIGVTVDGKDLPYYVRVRVTVLEKDNAKWNDAFANVKNPALLFEIQFEDYLTGAEYIPDKEYTVLVDIPTVFGEYQNFSVVLPNGKTVKAKADSGRMSFTTDNVGTFAVAGLDIAPDTGVANTVLPVAFVLLAAACVVLVGTKRRKAINQ